MVIGVVGKSCAGKDAVVSFLEDKGIASVNVDKLGHEALNENISLIEEAFGPEVIEDGSVNRKALAPIVFSDPLKLEKLNSITHPWMVKKTEELTKNMTICTINAALLESMGLVRLCDEILYVYAPLELRLERGMQRDGLTKEAFLSRNENQKEIGSTLFESGKRVITIINDADKEYLYRQVQYYCDILKARGLINE